MRTMLLGIVYFFVLSPVAALCRTIRDPLHRRPDPRRSTYWTFF